jgi:tRNA (cytidine/uridine-2'-O-)-methyltransferase
MPLGPKLRAKPFSPPFHVVLIEPEIPPNTGAVARTCAATGSPLHLVGKLGFRIDEQSVRRAGLDYWHLVDLRVHASFDEFLAANPDLRLHLFTAAARTSFFDCELGAGDALVFGKESVGLDPALLDRYPDRWRGLPTLGGVRSLNLSNAVAVAVYEGLRRMGALSHPFLETP